METTKTDLSKHSEETLLQIFEDILNAPGDFTNEDKRAISLITKEFKRRGSQESLLEKFWSKEFKPNAPRS